MAGSCAISVVLKPSTVNGARTFMAARPAAPSPTAEAGKNRAATTQNTKPSPDVTTVVETREAALRSRKPNLLRCSASLFISSP